MLRFLVHRFIGLAVTMFFVSIMVFVIMELPPGDYADRYAFRKFSGTGVNVTEGDIENIRIQFGLDKPAWQRYFQWVGGIVTRFDFGQSFAFETSVNNVIGKRLWMTLAILYSTLVLTYLLAIPIAIYAAIHRRSAVDYSLTVLSYLGLALPNFLLALILLYISVTLFGTSIGGLFSPEYEKAGWSVGKALDLLQHLIVPAIVLAWSATALQLQTVRATMLDELNKLSVTAARARGIPEWKLLLKYPARLAVNPVVSTIGFDVNRIFSELPIVALVLGLPELGELLIQSYLDLDMYVAGAVLLMLTFFIVVMNFISDIALAALDPRISLEG
ncbi:MAG: ABC transporter permease [Desulfofustis sp. PB-SRB1]|jgi:peptide/nickel transport system permease protein|nr:ABC transporter permease [Desulfofustis sp. PB-SRB1]MBM1001757.1 ABC transporter permease [Desulfofustis sp. PB-SRB1]HBH29126.1 ABC transporter permease [Desulfofustis sp.]HBH30842.1 ABC transporter permease [Desulfofustis sp.]